MRRYLLCTIVLASAISVVAFAGPGNEATTTGTTTAAGKEAPMLAELVAAGELPPVEERLPNEPKVKDEMAEIGQYGGTLRAFGTNFPTEEWDDMVRLWQGSASLLHITRDGRVIGDLAKDYELSDDALSFTLYLREGAKWSDGHPFTADDILFKYIDIALMEEVVSWSPTTPGMEISKVDDYTVKYEFATPSPVWAVNLGSWWGNWVVSYAPKHILEKWHIRYNADADTLAKEEGFDKWFEALNYHQWFNPTKDIDIPVMTPWAPIQYSETVKVFERNPYFYQVDNAGNQLPYIDQVIITYGDVESYQLKIISGEVDIATTHTNIQNYPLYKENEEAGGYRLVPVPGKQGADVAFGLNQNHEDPALGEIFRDVRFRRALSTAIDRDEINETIFYGLATPRQATCTSDASFYKAEWGENHPYAKYDPGLANSLLDEMGLTERDSGGFRTDPDGKAILLLIEYNSGQYANPAVFELVKEYWEAVGLKGRIKPGSANIGLRWDALDHVIAAHPFADVDEIGVYTGTFRLGADGLKEAPTWQPWLSANDQVKAGEAQLSDYEGGKLPGEEPPEHVKEQWDRLIQIRSTIFGSDEYRKIAQEICDYQAEYLYAIGVVGQTPGMVIANKNLGNINELMPVDVTDLPGFTWEAQQYYWKK